MEVAGFMLIANLARTESRKHLLWPVTMVCCVLMGTFVFFVSDPATTFEDFRKAYWQAGVATLGGAGSLVHLFDTNVFGFVNLPIIAYLFTPFGLMPDKWAGAVFALIGGGFVLYAWNSLTRLAALNSSQRAISLFAVAAYGPLIHSLRQANTSHILLALIVWGMIRLKGKREYLAGMAYGFAALIKPPLLLIGVYYFIRRAWKVVAGGTLVVLGGVLLSFVLLGVDVHRIWFESDLKPFLVGVVAAFNAQSLASTFARFELGTGVLWDWTPYVVSRTTRLLTLGTSLLLVVAGLWAGIKGKAENRDVELSTVLILVCLLSSLSWSHYFVWLLPAFCFLFAYSSPDGGSRELRPWLVISFLLAAPPEFLSAGMRDGTYPVPLLLAAHIAIAALLLYVLMLRLIASGKARILTSYISAPQR